MDASGKIDTSAINASSVAATYASPDVCDPVAAREKRRRYGRCGAIRIDRLIGMLPLTLRNPIRAKNEAAQIPFHHPELFDPKPIYGSTSEESVTLVHGSG